MKNSIQVDGMRDFSPKEVEIRNYVMNTILGVYNDFGFRQIDTPCVEKIDLLTNGQGGDNEKMLFKILKRGDKLNITPESREIDIVDLGLRYDLTVPLCRFFANNCSKLPQNFKAVQFGNVWRAERPQKGRFRQFTQCDIDIIGNRSILSEIELIITTSNALQKLDFKNFKIRINDRRILESLATFCGFQEEDFRKVFIILDKMDKIGIEGVRKELEASFSQTSIDIFMNIISEINVDNLLDFLPNVSETVLSDLKKVINTVSNQKSYSIEFDITLVRGMGYYTGQIFEIEIDGYKSSIAGGGRYDKMIGNILGSGEEIPACGFSIGFERIISILEERNFIVPNTKNKIAILYGDLTTFDNILLVSQKLREEGNLVSIEPRIKNLKKQINDLAEQGFNSFGIFNDSSELILKQINMI